MGNKKVVDMFMATIDLLLKRWKTKGYLDDRDKKLALTAFSSLRGFPVTMEHLRELSKIMNNPAAETAGYQISKNMVIPRLDRGIQNKRTGFSGQARE